MGDVSELVAAQEQASRKVAALAEDQWALPTPCEHWDVRALVVHMVEGCRMARALLDGASAEESRRAFGVAHDDVGAELGIAFADERDAFARPASFDMIVHHPAAGDIPGVRLYEFRTGDYLLHSWDLARATGSDERLPDDLVASVWTALQPMVPFIGQIGVFGTGPSGTVTDDAPLQERLLDLTGRRP
jgi:uncharacterized protein (TIGR03086 family)